MSDQVALDFDKDRAIDLLSAMHKLVRRGLTERAMLAGWELCSMAPTRASNVVRIIFTLESAIVFSPCDVRRKRVKRSGPTISAILFTCKLLSTVSEHTYVPDPARVEVFGYHRI